MQTLLEQRYLTLETAQTPFKSLLLHFSQSASLGLNKPFRFEPHLPDGETANSLTGLPSDRVQVALRLLEMTLMNVVVTFDAEADAGFRHEGDAAASQLACWFPAELSCHHMSQKIVLRLRGTRVDCCLSAVRHHLAIILLLHGKPLLDVLKLLGFLLRNDVA